MGKAQNKIEVVSSSGNVFADLGLPNAEEKQTKAAFGFCKQRILRKQQLSQVAAARR